LSVLPWRSRRKLTFPARVIVLLAGATLALALVGSTIDGGGSHATSASSGGSGVEILPGRVVHVGAPQTFATSTPSAEGLSVPVTLQNVSGRPLMAKAADFLLMAEGDTFSQVGAPAPAGSLSGQIAPGASRASTLTFLVPPAAVPAASILYHSTTDGVTGFIRFNSTTGVPPGASAARAAAGSVTGAATTTNTVEDNFTRANQAGWGTSTNADGVANVAWGMDGSGSLTNVTIAGNTGQYGYPGTVNQVGIASAGGTSHNGGDALVQFSVSAVGHVTPYVVENACADKSCYYVARMHTSQNRLEVAEGSGGNTSVVAAVPFTASAGHSFWMRLDVTYVSGSFNEHAANGVGDPWGTAVDGAGNVWFAEPGCDFGSGCSSSTPPGQIGEVIAATGSVNLYPLPNLTNNQPLFVALDGMGNVWFTTPNNDMIGEFNPLTHSFVGQWAVTPGTGPWDLTFNKGVIWYSEHYVSAVGEFNPAAHTHADFQTPTGSSNPYGIVGNDPANGNLVWFTENNGNVARIGVVDTANGNAIAEYLIRSVLPGSSLTAHSIALDAQGHPWWTEGWVHDIGTLNPGGGTPGSCGTASGDCLGVSEYALPTGGCSGSHVSGIHITSSGSVWSDDSLSAQLFSFDPSAGQFSGYALTNCGAHPHDGLNVDSSNHLWWDEEFANNIGNLIP